MISSVIATSHFYYLALIGSDQLKEAKDLIKYFPDKTNFEELSTANPSLNFFHVQAEIGQVLGSENLLLLNKSERSSELPAYYWYDFYLGDLEIQKKRYTFICYPYVRLSSYVDDFLLSNNINRKYLKPDVNLVLDYIKLNPDQTQGSFRAEISKYSAAVKDDSANKINILGNNPLNSRVYQLLSSDTKISIEPLSLKLKCSDEKSTFDLSFDKFGNVRFWLKRYNSDQLYSLLSQTINYFQETKVLYESSFISKTSILEDEQ
jgi:hypothetical protein